MKSTEIQSKIRELSRALTGLSYCIMTSKPNGSCCVSIGAYSVTRRGAKIDALRALLELLRAEANASVKDLAAAFKRERAARVELAEMYNGANARQRAVFDLQYGCL